jgi:hypothetical protein
MNGEETMVKLRKAGHHIFLVLASKCSMTLMPPLQPLINEPRNRFGRWRHIARSFSA